MILKTNIPKGRLLKYDDSSQHSQKLGLTHCQWRDSFDVQNSYGKQHKGVKSELNKFRTHGLYSGIVSHSELQVWTKVLNMNLAAIKGNHEVHRRAPSPTKQIFRHFSGCELEIYLPYCSDRVDANRAINFAQALILSKWRAILKFICIW